MSAEELFLVQLTLIRCRELAIARILAKFPAFSNFHGRLTRAALHDVLAPHLGQATNSPEVAA